MRVLKKRGIKSHLRSSDGRLCQQPRQGLNGGWVLACRWGLNERLSAPPPLQGTKTVFAVVLSLRLSDLMEMPN